MKSKRLRNLLIGMGVFPLALYAAAMAGIAVAGSLDDTARADVAIVLGNRIEANGQPSARLRARLGRALQLFESETVAHIIVSGGMGLEGFDEATVMKAWLVDQGIPEAKISMDHDGVNTWKTAENSARIMRARGYASAYAVSQYFHVPRARLALSRFGITEIYGAHPRYFEARDLYSTFREVAAYAVYRFRDLPPVSTVEPQS